MGKESKVVLPIFIVSLLVTIVALLYTEWLVDCTVRHNIVGLILLAVSLAVTIAGYFVKNWEIPVSGTGATLTLLALIYLLLFKANKYLMGPLQNESLNKEDLMLRAMMNRNNISNHVYVVMRPSSNKGELPAGSATVKDQSLENWIKDLSTKLEKEYAENKKAATAEHKAKLEKLSDEEKKKVGKMPLVVVEAPKGPDAEIKTLEDAGKYMKAIINKRLTVSYPGLVLIVDTPFGEATLKKLSINPINVNSEGESGTHF